MLPRSPLHRATAARPGRRRGALARARRVRPRTGGDDVGHGKLLGWVGSCQQYGDGVTAVRRCRGCGWVAAQHATHGRADGPGRRETDRHRKASCRRGPSARPGLRVHRSEDTRVLRRIHRSPISPRSAFGHARRSPRIRTRIAHRGDLHHEHVHHSRHPVRRCRRPPPVAPRVMPPLRPPNQGSHPSQLRGVTSDASRGGRDAVMPGRSRGIAGRRQRPRRRARPHLTPASAWVVWVVARSTQPVPERLGVVVTHSPLSARTRAGTSSAFRLPQLGSITRSALPCTGYPVRSQDGGRPVHRSGDTAVIRPIHWLPDTGARRLLSRSSWLREHLPDRNFKGVETMNSRIAYYLGRPASAWQAVLPPRGSRG